MGPQGLWAGWGHLMAACVCGVPREGERHSNMSKVSHVNGGSSSVNWLQCLSGGEDGALLLGNITLP